MKKKSQAEIFGIALFFVVIVFGVLIFSSINNIQKVQEKDLHKRKSYEIIANDVMNSLKNSNLDCGESVETKFYDVLEKCVDLDEIISCKNEYKNSCDAINEHINTSLYLFFNSTKNGSIATIPFIMQVEEIGNENSKIENDYTNFGEYAFRGVIINQSNYRKYGFVAESTEGDSFSSFPSSKVKMNFRLYFR